MGLMLTPRNQGESGSERDCSAPMPPPITAINVPHTTPHSASQTPSQISTAPSQRPSQITLTPSQTPSQTGGRHSSTLSPSPLLALSSAANHNGNVDSNRVNNNPRIRGSSTSSSTSAHGGVASVAISNLLSSHTQVNNQP